MEALFTAISEFLLGMWLYFNVQRTLDYVVSAAVLGGVSGSRCMFIRVFVVSILDAMILLSR